MAVPVKTPERLTILDPRVIARTPSRIPAVVQAAVVHVLISALRLPLLVTWVQD